MENNRIAVSPLQRLWRLIKSDREEVFKIYYYAIFSGLVNLSLPIGIQVIINLIQGGQVSTSWMVLILLVLSGVFLSGMLQVNQMKISENIQQKIFVRAAFEFTSRVTRIKTQFRQIYLPELMNRFFEVIIVQKGIAKLLLDLSAAGIQVIFGMILLSLYHPVFILFSVTLILILFLVLKVSAKKGLQTSVVESTYKYLLVHWLEEMARGAKFLRSGNHEAFICDETDKRVENYVDARANHFQVLLKQFYVMIGLKMLVTAGLLIIGGLLVIHQQINIGQFVAAEIIILLIISSVEKIMLNLETIYDVLTALDKLGYFTDLEVETEVSENRQLIADEVALSVEMQHVSVINPDPLTEQLIDISMCICPGEWWLIRGADNLRQQFFGLLSMSHDYYDGKLHFNDYPAKNIGLRELRKVIATVGDDDYLFNVTIRENILMGKSFPWVKIKMLAAEIGLHEAIKKLPMGYETLLMPDGKNIPADLRFRILLLRVLLSSPKILLIENFNQMNTEDMNALLTTIKKLSLATVLVSDNGKADESLFDVCHSLNYKK